MSMYKDFDAVLFPANRGANAPARAGYPSIVVPPGFVDNPAVAPRPSSPRRLSRTASTPRPALTA